MVTKTDSLVDVVVDVQTVHVDEPFTYSTGPFGSPALGTRVKVPFSGRTVSGWVVAQVARAPRTNGIKELAEVCDDAAIPAEALALANWIRRRYICTYREALLVVAHREPQAGERYAFVTRAAATESVAIALQKRFSDKPFSALSASRALRSIGKPMALGALRRQLSELVRKGTLHRSEVKAKGKRRKDADVIVELEDAGAARGPAQRRLASELASAGGSLPLLEARRRAAVSAASLRGAVAAGVVHTHEHHAARTMPRVPPDIADGLQPTVEQQTAIDRLDAAFAQGSAVALLQGVTGSGKTLVYARLIDRLRTRGGRAIVLVPEIALTPQTASRFITAFGARVGVLHSGLSQRERARVWSDAASGALNVVVGARSAVFAPLPRLELIILDEEHEASYKQDVAPRYDASAVARERMRLAGGSVLLGSATPSLETYWDALEGRMLHVRLTSRATLAPLPPVEIVDMTRTRNLHGRRALGPTLTAAIDARLRAGEKTLLFVNRRGYAGVLLCRSCGFAPRCRRCAVSLVIHAADRSMRCHVCGDAFRIPAKCPKCGAADLLPFGIGTQRVEEEVRELFPDARVVRMDSDSTQALGAHERLLDSFASDGDILIGTQMIAKGLDYPTVTLVGVVAADLDLNRPDFRAAERTFSLLTQVAGRAGRAMPGSEVIVQTYAPEHPAIALAALHDYDGFAAKELEVRRELRYPPFGRIAYLIVASTLAPLAQEAAASLAATLRVRAPGVEVLGPAPDVLPKARGEYRLRIALKTQSEGSLLAACTLAKDARADARVRTTIVVDPK